MKLNDFSLALGSKNDFSLEKEVVDINIGKKILEKINDCND